MRLRALNAKRALKRIGLVLGLVLGLLLLVGAGLALKVTFRPPLVAIPSTTHGTFERQGCIQCHAQAVNASLELVEGRVARLRITNDRVGHHLPTGGNWLSVRLMAYDSSGRMLKEQMEAFGRNETLVLDFWPFNADSRIPFGEQREIRFSLPQGHGTVEAVIRYHDWMRTRRVVRTLRRDY